MNIFQSTLPRGSDCYPTTSTQPAVDFNPRSLAGATQANPTLLSTNIIFQSTLPRGSDNVQSKYGEEAAIFQSTLPRGSDKILFCFSCCFSISIHAPSRERLLRLPIVRHRLPFQSTLPRGSDKARERHFCYQINFNPRSLAGATFTGKLTIRNKINFNPRSLAGATYH